LSLKQTLRILRLLRLDHFNHQKNVVSTGNIDVKSKNIDWQYHLRIQTAEDAEDAEGGK